nr:hypothetical protein [Tanacetum cinerariifolium]
MTCSLPHTYDEIKSMVQKQVQEDRGHQLAIMNLSHQFKNAITAKDELRKAYEECRDIPLVQRALIENFLKIESELDQQMQNAFGGWRVDGGQWCWLRWCSMVVVVYGGAAGGHGWSGWWW